MKKFLSILLAGALLGVLSMVLTGCNVVTDRKMKSNVEKALKEKYKEEFVCTRVIPGENINGSYSTVCYPAKDRALMFEAQILPKNMKLSFEFYPNALAAREFAQMFDNGVGDVLGTHFINNYQSLGIYDDNTTKAIVDGTFTLETYMTTRYNYNFGDDKSHKLEEGFGICIDTSTLNASYDEEWDTIMNALDNIRQRGINNGTDLCFRLWLFFVPHDVYEVGLEYSKSKIVNLSYLKDLAAGDDYKFNRIIHFDVGLDVDPITKEEYIKLREEVD